MRFDDFMYGGDMYGGDMFGAYGGADLPSFAVEPPAAAPSLPAPSSQYSPETLAAFGEQQKYLGDFIARTGYDTDLDKQYQSVARRNTLDDYASSSGGDPMAEMYQNPTVALSEDVLAERLRNAPPVGERITSFFTPQTNDQESAGRLSAKWNTPFRLYDGNMLVYEGVGPDAAAEAAALAGAISKEKGDKADWKVTQQVGDKWITSAKDAPDFSVVDAALKYGLPLAVSFIPGLNVLATMAAAGAASTTGNLLAGESLKNSLISGALSAATAGVLKGTPIGQSISKSVGNTVQSAFPGIGQSASKFASQAAADAAARAAGEIVVTGSRNVLSPVLSGAASTALAGGLSSVGQSLLTPDLTPFNPQMQTPETPLAVPPPAPSLDPDMLTVTAGRAPSFTVVPPIPFAPPPPLAVQPIPEIQAPPAEQVAASDEILVEAPRVPDFTVVPPIPFAPPPPLAVQPIPEIQAPPAEQVAASDEILVEAPRVPDFTVVPPIPFAPPPPLAVQPIPEIQAPPADDEIVVEAPRIPPSVIGLPPIPFNPIPDTSGLKQPEPDLQPADKKLSVSDYLRLAGLASSAIGLLGGGGGPEGTAAGIVPGGLGRLNPIFSAKLPTGADVNIPGGVGTASNLAARPVTDEDWLTYGQRPEKSFFNYVPQPATGMAHGGPLEAKRGGRPSRSSFAVNGPGTGRSDDIPAVLSDGEYVIDAETVALLGDGSSKAGAQKLDDLRVKIRKHKGQRLSQGRFSSDAKKPEAYLTGGRI